MSNKGKRVDIYKNHFGISINDGKYDIRYSIEADARGFYPKAYIGKVWFGKRYQIVLNFTALRGIDERSALELCRSFGFDRVVEYAYDNERKKYEGGIVIYWEQKGINNID